MKIIAYMNSHEIYEMMGIMKERLMNYRKFHLDCDEQGVFRTTPKTFRSARARGNGEGVSEDRSRRGAFRADLFHCGILTCPEGGKTAGTGSHQSSYRNSTKCLTTRFSTEMRNWTASYSSFRSRTAKRAASATG